MKAITKTTFVPMLAIKSGTMELDFYKKAFNAIALRCWNNDDGSIHVMEMEIDGAMFHFHEDKPKDGVFSPDKCHGVTTKIGLMVTDVDTVMSQALAAGAKEITAAKSYDYGYRQGEIEDPIGHRWLIEMVI